MSSLRWYHTQRWRRRAALQLKLHPLCAICLQNGQIVPATDADHIVPHKGDEWAFWFGELQSLCGSCHRSVKQKEEKHGYHSDIGIDGWPTDPAFTALMPGFYCQAMEKHGALIDAMASASASRST